MATIIFLPLTLLTGYFVRILIIQSFIRFLNAMQGMNFPNMWSLRGQGGHSDVVYVFFPAIGTNLCIYYVMSRFWIIALPIMAIILPIFLRRDIVRLVHYLSKYTAAQKAVKVTEFVSSAILWC